MHHQGILLLGLDAAAGWTLGCHPQEVVSGSNMCEERSTQILTGHRGFYGKDLIVLSVHTPSRTH